MNCANRPGFSAFLVGCSIAAQCALTRLLFTADAARVYLLGRPILWECGLRARYGVPCPACGMTRSVVLALHGEWSAAWQMAPGGVAAVLGLLLAAAVAWALAFAQWRQASRWEAAVGRAISRWAPVYGAAATVIWLAGWASAFQAALRLR